MILLTGNPLCLKLSRLKLKQELSSSQKSRGIPAIVFTDIVSHILSSEEREELELNNMKQWRPLPLDKKVLDGTGTFRRPIEKPQPTVPEVGSLLTKPLNLFQPFQFVTDSRIKEFRTSVEAEESTYKPLGSLETVKRSYEKLEPTVPQSPALSTKQRATLRSTDSFVVSQEPSTFKARPMPTFKPFEVKQVDFPVRKYAILLIACSYWPYWTHPCLAYRTNSFLVENRGTRTIC